MGQVNQVTPDGSLTYSQSGSQVYTDPTTGKSYQIPRYTATTTLSPEAQAIRDQNNAASLNLATLGANQSARADELLSQPFNANSLPQGADRTGWSPAQYGQNISAPQFSQTGAPLPTLSSGANLPKSSKATALPTASKGAALPEFADVGTSANLVDSYTPEGGFSADRQRVEDALMGRLNTERDRDYERLRTQLTNQGVNIGTEAYSRALQDFDRNQTDMRTNAILASGQEQSRLLGEARSAGQFTNDARQAGFNNELTGTGFNNANRSQTYQMAEDQRRYGDQFGLNVFGLAEDQRRYGDQFKMAQYQAKEDQRRYDDAQRFGLFGLAEDQRRYGDSMQQQGFANQQALQGRSDAVADAQFGQQSAIYDAQDNARLRELQTQLALRNQPINEITAMMSGSQVATPQFNIAQSAMIPTTDYAGIQQQGFNNQMANYSQQNANYQAMMGGLFGLGSSAILGRK